MLFNTTIEKPLLNLEVHLKADHSVPLLIFKGRESVDKQLSDFSTMHNLDDTMRTKLATIVSQKLTGGGGGSSQK